MEFNEHKEDRTVGTPQLSMTPMIDVVFLLIVFFLTVKFAEHAGELETRLPKAEGVIPRLQQSEVPDSPEVWIKVRPGKPGANVENGQLEPLKIELNSGPVKGFEELRYELIVLLARIRHSGDEPFVVLDMDGKLAYQSVVSTINVAKSAGIEDLNFTPPRVAFSQ